MRAGRYGCRVQTTADSVSDEAELLVRGEYANSAVGRHDHHKLSYKERYITCVYSLKS